MKRLRGLVNLVLLVNIKLRTPELIGMVGPKKAQNNFLENPGQLGKMESTKWTNQIYKSIQQIKLGQSHSKLLVL